MPDWIGNESVQIWIGQTRVEIWRKEAGKTWRLATYNLSDYSLNWDVSLHTCDLKKAKGRACKRLIEVFTTKRNEYDGWITELKDD